MSGPQPGTPGAPAPEYRTRLPEAPPPPPPPPDPEKPGKEPERAPRRKRSFWRELPVLVVLAFAIALLIKTFLLQAFFIPSASMEATLMEGDRVLVEKVGYRFREPERGQVVVFERDLGRGFVPVEDDPPSVAERIADSIRGLFGFPTGTQQDFIKRVVAVGGDEVEGRDGRVFVNGRAVDEPYVFDGAETSGFGPVTVPRGMIFVMGDNRNNSDDSRSFGPISTDEVVGRAFVVIWPPSHISRL